MISLRRGLCGAAAVTLALTTAACSSSSKNTTSPTTASQSTSSPSSSTGSASNGGTQATGTPVKVGVICSCSGPFGATILPAQDVYRAWVNTINASGGLGGHPIQLILKDDTATPGTSVTDVESLISSHVAAIFDESLVDEPWAATVEASGIPVVGGNLSETTFYSNPDFYPEGQTNDSITLAAVSTAKVSGGTNLGIFYCVEAPTCLEGANTAKGLAPKVGIPDVYNASISATAPNYTAQCVAAQQDHVSALLILHGAVEVARVGTNCSQQGFSPIYITEGEGFGLNLTTAPGVKDNLWSAYNNIPFFATVPAIQQMNAALDKYYPGLRNNNTVWTELAVGGWSSGILLEDAVKASGASSGSPLTAAAIVKGLEALNADTLQGTAPPLTFAAGKTHSVSCWFTAHMSGGVPAVTNGGKVTCANGTSS
jgi:branched-chain amino acid transport system substrate-binding protein